MPKYEVTCTETVVNTTVVTVEAENERAARDRAYDVSADIEPQYSKVIDNDFYAREIK